MGVRIEVYLSHDLPRFDSPAETLSRLNSVLPAAFAVRDYWRSTEQMTHDPEQWQAEPASQRLPDLRSYEGPGSLWVTVTPFAARINTGGRWRGFLNIGSLRKVHLAAFREIARVMGSATMALCADSRDDVADLFTANATQKECIAQMRTAMGPPQPSVELIAPEIVAQAEHGLPDVWFVDRAPGA